MTDVWGLKVGAGSHVKGKTLPSVAARETLRPRVTDCSLLLSHVAIVSGHSRKTCEWEVRESKQSRPAGDRALCPDAGRQAGRRDTRRGPGPR